MGFWRLCNGRNDRPYYSFLFSFFVFETYKKNRQRHNELLDVVGAFNGKMRVSIVLELGGVLFLISMAGTLRVKVSEF